MANKSKKKKKQNTNSQDSYKIISNSNCIQNDIPHCDNENKERKKFKIDFKWLITTLLTCIGAAFTVYGAITQKFENVSVNIANLQKEQELINEKLTGVEEKSNQIYKDIYEDEGVKTRVREMWERLNMEAYQASDEVSKAIGEVNSNKLGDSGIHASITRTTVIGTDANGVVHLADELIDKTIILVYPEDDKQVFFMGQFNDSYHWDGYCITNVYYNDGTLYGLCESNFNDGSRLDYISLYKDSDYEWTYTNRDIEDGVNKGISKIYAYSTTEIKNFTETNVRAYDFELPDDYIEQNNFRIIKYYSGDTSDKRYNDTSGNAYEIIYYDDGTIKTLYCGKFVDGNYKDNTGNAWDISYSENEGCYRYNKGQFINNHAVDTDNSEIVDLKRIEQIIDGKNFECELRWR